MATSTAPRGTAVEPPTPPEPITLGHLAAKQRVRPGVAAHAHRNRVGAWVALAVACLAATVVQPQWPVQIFAALLWFGGVWRLAAVPLGVVLVAAITTANTVAPGATWHVLSARARRGWSWLPAAAALFLGLSAAGYSAGLLAPATLLRALLMLLLQLVLFPGTPLLALLAALAAVVLAADTRQERAVAWARAAWAARPRAPEAALRASWPAALTWLGGALVAAALFPAAMQGWGRADGPDAQRYNFYTSFFNYSFNDERVVQREGFDLGGCGLTLAPGASGSIVFRLERTPESLVLLKANFYNRATGCQVDSPGASSPPLSPATTFANALDLSIDQGNSYRPVLADATVGEVVGSPVQDLTPLLGASRTYLLRFSAANTTGARVTVLPSFVASVVVDPLAVPHPLFPVVPYLGTTAFLVYCLARLWGTSRRNASSGGIGVAALAGVIAAALLRWTPGAVDQDVMPALAAARATVLALVALLAGSVLLRERLMRGGTLHTPGTPAYRVPWLAIACLVVALVALDARWEQLIRLRYEFLLPDAQGYQAIAVEFPRKMAHYRAERYSDLLDQLYASGYDGRANAAAVFYAGGNNGREPLWPGTLRLIFNLLGESAFHTRLTSLLCSVLVASLTCWLGWRTLHPLAGITAGVVVATSQPLIENGVAGLREELVSALGLLLVATLFAGARRSAPPGRGRIAVAGATAAAVILVRADMVILAGAALTLAALALRWPWRHWLAAVAVAGALAGPMYIGYAFTHHDPFYPGTYGATVNRNLEFPERMGTPGFPTAEEYAGNWAAGPPISPLKYFFGYHTVPQFAAYSLRGTQRIFRDILFVGREKPLLWLFVAGVALLALTRRWLVPGAVAVALLPFYAFLAGVPNPWVFAPRYAHHAFPYAALAVAFGIWWLPIWIGRNWSERFSWQAK